MRRALLSTLAALAVSAAVLWWLLSPPVLAALAEALRAAHLGQLALAWLLVPVIQALRAVRFKLLTPGQPRPAIWTMYVITARLLLFNYLLPFKFGEISFPLMMKRAFGSGYLRGAGILVLARLLDLCVVCAVFALGAALLIDPVARPWSLPLLLLALGIALAMPVVGVELLAPLARLGGRLLRLEPWLDRMRFDEVLTPARATRAWALALTVAIWLTHAALAYNAARAVAPGVEFFPIMLANAASHLAFAVPVSGLAGLGPPQAAWAAVLHLTGVPWRPAVVTALVVHGVLLSGALVIGIATFVLPGRPPHGHHPAPG